jgi:hypothetical protein
MPGNWRGLTAVEATHDGIQWDSASAVASDVCRLAAAETHSRPFRSPFPLPTRAASSCERITATGATDRCSECRFVVSRMASCGRRVALATVAGLPLHLADGIFGNCGQRLDDVALWRSWELFEMIQRHR